MKSAFVLACVFLLPNAGVASSQDSRGAGAIPSRSKIEGLLRSGEPRQVAWGAHYVVATGDQRLVPVLIAVTDNWQPITGATVEGMTAEQYDLRDAIAAVLDGLIQLNVQAPVSTLRNLAEDFPAYVAILLSRLPPGESQGLSWDLYHSEPHSLGADDLQYVSAALLAEAPPPGFAADLFSSIHIETTIFVERPEKPSQIYGTGGSFGCSVPTSRKGWPEFGVYAISENKTAEALAIVSHEHPLYAFRVPSMHYAGDRCEAFSFVVLGPEERRNFIAQMLEVASDDLEWGATMRKTMVFHSEPEFYHDLASYIAQQQEDFRETAQALVEKNLMTDAERQDSMPRIDLRIVDRRGPGFAPLVQPVPLPAHVKWIENSAPAVADADGVVP